MNKNFVTATPDSGSGGATVSVSASENQGGSRSTSLNVGGSGVNKSVSVSQEAATIEYKYEASIYPTLQYWNYDEFIEKGFQVTATQTKYVNGKPAGSKPANWSFREGSYSDPSTNYFSARKDGNWLYISLETQNDTGQEQYQVYDIITPSGVSLGASCRAAVYG